MAGTRTIEVQQDVRAALRQQAAELRDEFTRQGTLVVNLLSSPGAGKTSLLEATARFWNGRFRCGVLVGDLETDRDAQRLAPLVPTRQLTTGGACHLELPLVRQGLERLREDIGNQPLDFLLIENIGNLVCPASHDLAEHLRVVVLSTTEGDDKPGKYPKMFRTSHAMVISKSDLLPHVPFSVDAAIADARLIRPEIEAFQVCSLRNDGLQEWCQFLQHTRERMVTGDEVLAPLR